MFGRKRAAAGSEPTEGADAGPAYVEPADPDRPPPSRTHGPWDVADVDLDAPGPERIDLGSLVVTGVEGVELRLQADQSTGAVTAVVLASDAGALELRPFAAPKSGGLWDELRGEIGAEATRLGGTVDEEQGRYGPQLRLRVPVKGQGGRSGVQVSRVVAVEGPRWLLRVTFLGAAEQDTDTDADAPLERALRDVVVVRGEQAMRPREPLPLRLPPQARAAAEEAPPSTGS